jgi:hypothetical protein
MTNCPLKLFTKNILKNLPKIEISQKKRLTKKTLHNLSAFFILESWEILKSNNIESKIEQSFQKFPPEFKSLIEYLDYLKSRNPCFGWAWIRARIDEVIKIELENTIVELAKKYPDKYNLYTKSLLKNGRYWFRQSVGHHLKLGYHTAISVLCKYLAGVKFEVGNYDLNDEFLNNIRLGIKTFASFDLDLLHASDQILWDSASAKELGLIKYINNDLYIPEKLAEKILSNWNKIIDTKGREAILGCPALKAKKTETLSVFDEFYEMIVKIIQRI